MKKLHLAIACFSLCLGKGGSERAAVNLAEAMAARGHKVILLSFIGSKGGTSPAYPLSPQIRHLAMNVNGWHGEIARLGELLSIEKIDVLLSLGASAMHFFWSMACMNARVPIIYSERSDPVERIEKTNWNRPGRMAALYSADCIHELLPMYVNTVPEALREKVVVIPNCAPPHPLPATMQADGQKTLLYLGRLCDEKRPLLLLEAFCLVKNKYPDWNLEIWGHGYLENDLLSHIKKAGVPNRIIFRGQCDNPEFAYANAQIYCLPSSHEGFPNTVLEAMAAGLPIAGYKSCNALANIIENGRTGILAGEDTPQSLAGVLDKLMGDPDLRANLGHAAREAAADYEPIAIYDRWEKLFYDMTNKQGTIMGNKLASEKFRLAAELSASARQEWLLREFAEPLPWTFAWFRARSQTLARRLYLRKTCQD